MADGPVYTQITWEAWKTLVKVYCDVYPSESYDTLLLKLFSAAVRKADEYLCNPFEVLRPTIAFSGVEVNDYVIVNGQTYTIAATADESEREFALEDEDSDTADNFCTLMNSTTLGGSYGAVGVAGVSAANSEGIVTLSRRYLYPDGKLIEVVSSDEDKLLVRQVRTSLDIPDDVGQWVMQRIKRHFDNRDALISENISGLSVKMWLSMKSEEAGMVDNFDLIDLYRLLPSR